MLRATYLALQVSEVSMEAEERYSRLFPRPPPGTAPLTITTTAATSGARAYQKRPAAGLYAAWGTCLAFLSLVGILTRGRNRLTKVGIIAALLIFIGGFIACGGGGSSKGGGGNPGTTPGSYTVIVTGTSGSITAAGTVTL